MSDSNLPSARPDPQSDIETLYALASLATTASDARSAQSSILATIMASFPADSGSLSLLSPESGRLEISAQMGLPPETGDFALRPGQGITGCRLARQAAAGRRCQPRTALYRRP